MENKKCSLKNHEDLLAINYCQECKIRMCHKCTNFHKEIFEHHHMNKLVQESNEVFNGFCPEKGHNLELEFFCKSHNQLCCAACLCKIKSKGKGQHSECEVCTIEEIKETKKRELAENINILEKFTKTADATINELKAIYEEINKNKEDLKHEVQTIFTKIRTKINEREDKIMMEIEKQYNELYFKEEILKKSEKLPKKMCASLEKGKAVSKEWENANKLNYIIYNCIGIENNIKEMNEINDCINKYKETNCKIKFFPEEEEMNQKLKEIESFGEIKKLSVIPILQRAINFKPGIDFDIDFYRDQKK